METFRPLAVVAGVPVKEGIRFTTPTRTDTITDHIELVWAIIESCDGVTDADLIAKKVSKKTQVDVEFVRAVIDDLTSLGVLLDSRRAYRYFHHLGDNLTMYASDMRPEEVYDFQISAHPPRRIGETFFLPQTTETVVGGIGGVRRSCRSFLSEPIMPEHLGEVLRVAFSREVAASPSGGGMNPIRAYLLVLRGAGELVPGKYEYDSDTNALIRFDDELDRQELEFALNSDSLLYGAAVVVVIAAELDRGSTKYANRGYRYALIESGHAAQSVLLTATELGLASLEYCGFQDRVVARLFGLKDGIAPIVTIALGSMSSSPMPDVIEDLNTALSADIVGRGRPVTWVNIVNSPDSTDDYSFFHCISHYRAGSHDNARRSYRERVCGGTSTSLSLAMVKATVEAYERNRSGIVHIDEVATAQSLGSRQWLDPRVYAPYSDEQLALSSLLGEFDEAARYEWVKGYRYVSQETVMVPIDLVFYPLSPKKLGRKLCHYANSSGIAAHTTMEEAVKGALLELVERDAIMRGWYEKRAPGRIAIQSLPIHWRKRTEYWQQRGFEVVFLDLSENGVCIIAVTIRSLEHYPHFVSGTAASIDSLEAAYTKAYQEAELTLLHFRAEHKRSPRVEELAAPLDHGRFYAEKVNQGLVAFLYSGCYTTPGEPSATFDSLCDDHDPTVVDLSGDYPGLKVVRVFCKELVPVGFGYGAGHHTHHALSGLVRQRSVRKIAPHYLA